MIAPRLTHYRITAKLGEGGWARSIAPRIKLGREVAIKFCPRTSAVMRKAHRSSARPNAGGLNHPHIAAFTASTRTRERTSRAGAGRRRTSEKAASRPLRPGSISGGDRSPRRSGGTREGHHPPRSQTRNVKLTPNGRVKCWTLACENGASWPWEAEPATAPGADADALSSGRPDQPGASDGHAGVYEPGAAPLGGG